MRKRVLGFILALAMVFGLCGCKIATGFEVYEDGTLDVTTKMLIDAEFIDALCAESGGDANELLESGYELVTIDGKQYYQYAATEPEKIGNQGSEAKITPNSFVAWEEEAYEELESISDETISSEDLIGQEELGVDNMEDYITMELYVTFQQPITKTNGVLSDDQKTASWAIEDDFGYYQLYAFTDDYTDSEKPVIKGVKNHQVYNKAVKVKYSDNCGVIKSATLDGKKFVSGKKVSKAGTHTVVVEDLFGNKRTVSFTIEK